MTAPPADTSSALEVLLHPLVVMSIADHHTRQVQSLHSALSTSSSSPPPGSRVFGLLFGHMEGRIVSVAETLEMAYKRDSAGKLEVQQAALEVDMELCPLTHAHTAAAALSASVHRCLVLVR